MSNRQLEESARMIAEFGAVFAPQPRPRNRPRPPREQQQPHVEQTEATPLPSQQQQQQEDVQQPPPPPAAVVEGAASQNEEGAPIAAVEDDEAVPQPAAKESQQEEEGDLSQKPLSQPVVVSTGAPDQMVEEEEDAQPGEQHRSLEGVAAGGGPTATKQHQQPTPQQQGGIEVVDAAGLIHDILSGSLGDVTLSVGLDAGRGLITTWMGGRFGAKLQDLNESNAETFLRSLHVSFLLGEGQNLYKLCSDSEQLIELYPDYAIGAPILEFLAGLLISPKVHVSLFNATLVYDLLFKLLGTGSGLTMASGTVLDVGLAHFYLSADLPGGSDFDTVIVRHYAPNLLGRQQQQATSSSYFSAPEGLRNLNALRIATGAMRQQLSKAGQLEGCYMEIQASFVCSQMSNQGLCVLYSNLKKCEATFHAKSGQVHQAILAAIDARLKEVGGKPLAETDDPRVKPFTETSLEDIDLWDRVQLLTGVLGYHIADPFLNSEFATGQAQGHGAGGAKSGVASWQQQKTPRKAQQALDDIHYHHLTPPGSGDMTITAGYKELKQLSQNEVVLTGLKTSLRLTQKERQEVAAALAATAAPPTATPGAAPPSVLVKLNPTLTLLGSATGRMQTKAPNVQNLPKGGKDPLAIRSCITAPAGMCLVAMDYSQIELRVLAQLSGDAKLLSLFQDGKEEAFQLLAKKLFAAGEDGSSTSSNRSQATAEQQRQTVKVLVYGILYGMGDQRIQESLQEYFPKTSGDGRDQDSPSPPAAQQIRKKFFELFPEVQQFISRVHDSVQWTRMVQTLGGRPRMFQLQQNPDDHEAKRQAVSTIIQGTASEILKSAMWSIHRWLNLTSSDGTPAATAEAVMLLPIHDELLFAIETEEIQVDEEEEEKEEEEAEDAGKKSGSKKVKKAASSSSQKAKKTIVVPNRKVVAELKSLMEHKTFVMSSSSSPVPGEGYSFLPSAHGTDDVSATSAADTGSRWQVPLEVKVKHGPDLEKLRPL